MERLVLLSFDAEEFDIPAEYGCTIGADEQLRVGGEGVRRVLGLLERAGVRATFFTTAVFARAFPDLVRRMVGEGHELASHGYAHSSWSDDDLARSRIALQEIAGVPVAGFRRPRMAPTSARKVLEAGYRYNSSENPIWLPGRYNRFFRPRRAYWALLDRPGQATPPEPVVGSQADALLHIPASAAPLLRWPLFWLAFKRAPLCCTRLATRACIARDGYAALYFHPWEFCDLTADGGYALPTRVRQPDGDRLLNRLARYIAWARRLPGVAFATYADLDARIRDRRWVFSPPAIRPECA
jgi:hypothetical protein